MIREKEYKARERAMSEVCADVLKELERCTITSPFSTHDYADANGMAEPYVRAVIRELRLQGIRICSNPNRSGYWLEERGGGYEETRRQMLSRAFRLLEVVRAMDGNKDGQMEWAELLEEVSFG